MKQALSILLVIQLLVHSFSITLSAHWCRGDLVEAKLFFSDSDLSCTGMSNPSNCEKEQQAGIRVSVSCCLTQHFKVETDNDFVASSPFLTAFDIPFFPAYRSEGMLADIVTPLHFIPGNHEPPGCKKTLIQHQVFRC